MIQRSVIVSGGVGIAKDVHIGGTLNSGTIKGDIDIDADKTITINGTLDTTAGTLTTSSEQNKHIIENADSDINIGEYKLTSNQLQVEDTTTFKGTATFDGNVIFNSESIVEFHNQQIEGVTINDTTIGETTPSTGKFTNIDVDTLKLNVSMELPGLNIINSCITVYLFSIININECPCISAIG